MEEVFSNIGHCWSDGELEGVTSKVKVKVVFKGVRPVCPQVD